MPSIREKKIEYCQKKSQASDGKTTLFIACSFGFLPECQWLAKHHPNNDITQRNINGVSPFEESFNSGYLQICQWLITQGALSPDISDESNCNTLAKNIFLNPKKRGFSFISYNDIRCENFLKLSKWSQKVVNEYYSFTFWTLPNSLFHRRNIHSRCYLWKLGQHGASFRIVFINLISSFLGIETEESFNYVKQFLKDIKPLRNRGFLKTERTPYSTREKKRRRKQRL